MTKTEKLVRMIGPAMPTIDDMQQAEGLMNYFAVELADLIVDDSIDEFALRWARYDYSRWRNRARAIAAANDALLRNGGAAGWLVN